MPTYSSAIADNIPEPQRPEPQRPRAKRPKEFWEIEPSDPQAKAWQDNPEDPTGPQLGNPATNASATAEQMRRSSVESATNSPEVVITNQNPQKEYIFLAEQNGFSKYTEFVDSVTSKASQDPSAFIARIAELQAQGCPMHRLLTASIGMSAEAGEFLEIAKKIAFQGKPYTEDNIEHLKIELGDIMWYVAQACISLDVSLDEILDRNISKLGARYPEGTFDAYYSENRKKGDL